MVVGKRKLPGLGWTWRGHAGKERGGKQCTRKIAALKRATPLTVADGYVCGCSFP